MKEDKLKDVLKLLSDIVKERVMDNVKDHQKELEENEHYRKLKKILYWAFKMRIDEEVDEDEEEDLEDESVSIQDMWARNHPNLEPLPKLGYSPRTRDVLMMFITEQYLQHKANKKKCCE